MGRQSSLSPAERFACKLGLSPEESQDFVACLQQGQSSRRAYVLTPQAPTGYRPPNVLADAPSWVGDSIFVASPDGSADEATATALADDYAAGFYYPLDLSSVWETAPLKLIDSPQRCLDLCSAPGGKSILTQARLHPQMHISNEVHPKRLGILRHNLSRCGFHHMWTQRLRPEQWSEQAPHSFDLVLVDAPCSGQSMLAKGIENPGCFNNSVVSGNAKRQRGILNHAVQVLAPGGHLLYTTCTYAPEENERTVAWLLRRMPQLQAVEVPELAEFQVPDAPVPCYRLMPQKRMGAGGFTCLLKSTEESGDLPDLDDSLLAWPIAER
jgi:16S rRNA C967 or C1407 C5-methylase (RsmB/RsmF family)